MGKKKIKKRTVESNGRAKQVAQAGLFAVLLAGLSWLVGGFSRDNALEWVKSLLIAVGLALLIRWPVGEPFKIPSSSMEPTLQIGDRIFVNKWIYGVKFPFNGYRIPFTSKKIWYTDHRIWRGAELKRWDIVVFYSVEKDPEHAKHDILVKRIVGLPGERIHIANGKVYVNDEPLELPPDMPEVEYTSQLGMMYGILKDDQHAVVPPDHYLLLGDNSSRSRDGRYFGWVPSYHILGRVSNIWWPIWHWRDFTGFSNTWWWRSIVGALGLLLIWRLFLGRSWHVQSNALAPFLTARKHVFISRWPFGIPVPFSQNRMSKGRAARRGEMVLYHPPKDKSDSGPLLGHVAGIPGDYVYFDDGVLTINGKPLSEPATLAGQSFGVMPVAGTFGRTKAKECSLVPEDHYFVLVNNPDESPDSRTLGWIAHANLIGAASKVWWPLFRK